MYTNEDMLEQSEINNTSDTGYMPYSAMESAGNSKALMPLFLLIDTSGSMGYEHKIQQVENAMEDIVGELRVANTENPDTVIKISILCFDDSPRWEAQVLDPGNSSIPKKFVLGCRTNMGAAFMELKEKLSREHLIKKGTCDEYKRAVIILLSDGGATDDVYTGISELMKNHWFTKATRVAFAIGNDADTNCLERFTGHPDTVLTVQNIQSLAKLLSSVAVVLSKANTYSPNGEDPAEQAQKEKDFRESAEKAAEALKELIEEKGLDESTGNNTGDDGGDLFNGLGFSTN